MTSQSQKTEKHLRERLEKKDNRINSLSSMLKNAQQQGFTVSAAAANPELENQNRELQSENRDLQGKNREMQNRNRELQNQVAQLQRGLQNGKMGHSDANAKKVEQLTSALWVEQKFSKEMQGHYKGLVDLVVKRNSEQPDSKGSELVQKEMAQLESRHRQELNTKDAYIQRLEQEKARLMQENERLKASSQKKPPRSKKNRNVKEVATGSKSAPVHPYSESQIRGCAVCKTSGNEADLYKVPNPQYKKDEETKWISTPGTTNLFLYNQPYCVFHRRCTRGRNAQMIPSIIFAAAGVPPPVS